MAVLLPCVLLVAGLLDCQLNSLSHYYFSKYLGAFFVGTLVGLATLLFAYTGQNRLEDRVAKIMAVCALLVALFPTGGDPCEGTFKTSRIFLGEHEAHSPAFHFEHQGGDDSLKEYTFIPYSGIIHFGAAAVLFFLLSYYSALIFTRVNWESAKKDKTHFLIPSSKRTRNRFYIGCTLLILCSIVAMGGVFLLDLFAPNLGVMRIWGAWNLTFWFEALALIAFGLAWFVKGRLLGFAALLGDEDEAAELWESSNPWVRRLFDIRAYWSGDSRWKRV